MAKEIDMENDADGNFTLTKMRNYSENEFKFVL